MSDRMVSNGAIGRTRPSRAAPREPDIQAGISTRPRKFSVGMNSAIGAREWRFGGAFLVEVFDGDQRSGEPARSSYKWPSLARGASHRIRRRIDGAAAGVAWARH